MTPTTTEELREALEASLSLLREQQAVLSQGEWSSFEGEVLALLGRIEEQSRICAMLCQVIGNLSHQADLFDDEQVNKALDMAARGSGEDYEFHEDLLPFTPKSPLTAQVSQLEEALAKAEVIIDHLKKEYVTDPHERVQIDAVHLAIDELLGRFRSQEAVNGGSE